MIAILVVTHETLGFACTQVVQHIFDHIPNNISIVGVNPNDELEHVSKQLNQTLKKISSKQGMLILTDLFGASPFNFIRKLTKNQKRIILTGLNAPMLIKAIQATMHDDDLPHLAASVKKSAIRGILTITDEENSLC